MKKEIKCRNCKSKYGTCVKCLGKEFTFIMKKAGLIDKCNYKRCRKMGMQFYRSDPKIYLCQQHYIKIELDRLIYGNGFSMEIKNITL